MPLTPLSREQSRRVDRLAIEKSGFSGLVLMENAGRGVADKGGLHVIATERHESGRIDRQLFGRCARQGDPGSAQAFMSVEDELIRRFVPAPMRKQLAAAIRSRTPGMNRLAEAALNHAQRAAQRLAYRQRRNVLKMDTWLEEALAFTGSGTEF